MFKNIIAEEKDAKALCIQLSGMFSRTNQYEFLWRFFVSDSLRDNWGDLQSNNPDSELNYIVSYFHVLEGNLDMYVTFLEHLIRQQDKIC